MSIFKEIVLPTGLFLLGLLLLGFGVGSIINHANLPGEIAQIEVVREAVNDVSPNEAEDIMGQAVEVNRLIASNQTYNKLWWACIFIPNGWDNVELIDISRLKKGS